jgi:hypothetical protein
VGLGIGCVYQNVTHLSIEKRKHAYLEVDFCQSFLPGGRVDNLVGVKCDKESCDPKHHTGPFKLLHVDEEYGLRTARCEGCGNAVYRYVKKPKQEEKTKPETP